MVIKLVDKDGGPPTDQDIAKVMRETVASLNELVEVCAQRELIVRYTIKEGQRQPGRDLTNPRLIVSVMSEVL